MKKAPPAICILVILFSFRPYWGFFAHQQINRMAVFTLPPAMIGFYKTNLDDISRMAVNPDRRRFSVADEAPRHYIDLDHYGDSAWRVLPRYWSQAVEKYSEDTLKAYGVVPWHIFRVYGQLKEAFMIRDPARIVKLSAELGHYISDAHVPLHTTQNYNGQLTGQDGIHAFWESRLPELFSEQYNFMTGRAIYLENPQEEAWKAVISAHLAVDSVLREEKKLGEAFGEKKFSFETKGNQTVKVYARDYAAAYHRLMSGMVERQMRASIRMTGSFWYTAWVEAGQPELQALVKYKPSEDELRKNREELEQWKRLRLETRMHEGSDN